MIFFLLAIIFLNIIIVIVFVTELITHIHLTIFDVENEEIEASRLKKMYILVNHHINIDIYSNAVTAKRQLFKDEEKEGKSRHKLKKIKLYSLSIHHYHNHLYSDAEIAESWKDQR